MNETQQSTVQEPGCFRSPYRLINLNKTSLGKFRNGQIVILNLKCLLVTSVFTLLRNEVIGALVLSRVRLMKAVLNSGSSPGGLLPLEPLSSLKQHLGQTGSHCRFEAAASRSVPAGLKRIFSENSREPGCSRR